MSIAGSEPLKLDLRIKFMDTPQGDFLFLAIGRGRRRGLACHATNMIAAIFSPPEEAAPHIQQAGDAVWYLPEQVLLRAYAA